MRIIENNYQNPNQEYEITCPHCKSKLSYTYDDVISDKSDNEWIYCEACHEQIIICDNEKTLTVDIVQYPQDFYSFENGVPVKDTEINKWIRECVNDLDKNIDYASRGSGDTLVFAYKSDQYSHMAEVVVAKKYQETEVEIPADKY